MSTFQFLNGKLDQTPILPNCQVAKMAFFDIIVNFIIQKLKSRHLVCLSLLWFLFWGIERKYFTHIPGLSILTGITLFSLQGTSNLNCKRFFFVSKNRNSGLKWWFSCLFPVLLFMGSQCIKQNLIYFWWVLGIWSHCTTAQRSH